VRYLAVDPGGRKIGFAIGDDHSGVTSPFGIEPYKGVDHAARLIARVAEESKASRVVLGWPTLEDGSAGPATRRTDLLAEALAELGVEVVLQKEFLTTNEARQRARAAGRSPRQPVDDIAAQVVLEEYLATRQRAETREG
jgi:putative transcription antitermination factor YqgF